MKNLYIKWPCMPGTLAKYRVKPLQYLSHVIGHEGQNSLLSTLIRKGLANSLSAGEILRLNQQQSGFQIQISLTDKGVKNWEEILKLIFAFVNQIKQDGPLEYIFLEKKIMAEINFNNMQKSAAIDLAQSKALAMTYFGREKPIEDILFAPYDLSVWDPQEI